MSLLDDAKKVETVAKADMVTPDQIELAVAWAEGNVSISACAKALNTKVPQALTYMARFLGVAVRDGYLKRTSKMRSAENNNGPTAA